MSISPEISRMSLTQRLDASMSRLRHLFINITIIITIIIIINISVRIISYFWPKIHLSSSQGKYSYHSYQFVVIIITIIVVIIIIITTAYIIFLSVIV